jgi:hypothetical protein
MSVVVRLLSSGAARGLAALLALLLSAIIGGRLGVDRLSLDLVEEEDGAAVDCPLIADLSGDVPVVGCTITGDPVLEPGTGAPDAILPTVPDHRPFPGLLRGSAGGPRAP